MPGVRQRLISFVLVVASLVVVIAAGAVVRFLGVRRLGGGAAVVLAEAALVALVIAGFSALAKYFNRAARPLDYQGLPLRAEALRDAVFGLLLGTIMVQVAVALLWLAGGIRFDMVAFTPGMAHLVGYNILLLALAAMSEELIFRGYPFQRLVDAVGAPLAVALLSLSFGLVHRSNPNATWTGVANTVLVGVVFSVAYLRTRALWLPWGLHFAWNFTLGSIFGLPVSGLMEFRTVLRGHTEAPAWLSGGAYGIEAGAAGTIAVLLGLVVVLSIPRHALVRVIVRHKEVSADAVRGI